MRHAVVSVADVMKASRWDPAYHLAVQEAGRRFPSWTDDQARALLEPLAPRLPTFIRQALAPLGRGNTERTLSSEEALKVIQTYPMASLGCIAPHIERWKEFVAAEEQSVGLLRQDVDSLAVAVAAVRRPKP